MTPLRNWRLAASLCVNLGSYFDFYLFTILQLDRLVLSIVVETFKIKHIVLLNNSDFLRFH